MGATSRRALGAALVVVLLAVTGCSGGKPNAALAAGVIEAKVAAHGATTVPFDGGQLVIPQGAAPAGTRVRISRLAAPALNAQLAALFRVRGPGVDVDLGGRQPAVPLTLRFDRAQLNDPALSPVVLTQHTAGGNWDVLAPTASAAGHVTVATPHLSAFWDAALDIGRMAASVTQYFTGARTPAPRCSTAPVKLAGETVLLQPDDAWNFDPAPAYSCLTVTPGKAGTVTVDLSPTSAAPWRVTGKGATVTRHAVSSSAGAVMDQLAAQSTADGGTLVAPGISPSYELPIDKLPLTLTARSDAGWWLATGGVVAGETLLSAFKLKGVPKQASHLAGLADCVNAAAETTGAGLGLSAQQAGLAIAAGLSCVALIAPPTLAVAISLATTGTAFLEAISTDQLRRFSGRATAHLVVDVLRPATAGPVSGQCSVVDLEIAWEGGKQSCLEPEVLSHLFFSGTSLSTKFAGVYRQDVVFVQLRLRDLGQKVVIDGNYGSQTANAVKEFQREKGFIVDGVVGLETWRGLFGLGAA